MSEEKELTEEERKAKEYVDFYYFWLLQYFFRRNRHLVLCERKVLIEQIRQIVSVNKPVISKEASHRFFNDSESEIYSGNCLSVSIENNNIPNYISALCRIDGFCVNRKCKSSEELIELLDSYNYADEYIAYDYIPDLCCKEDHELTSSDILDIVLSEEGLQGYLERIGCVERCNKNFGIGVLGLQDITLDNEGRIRGKINIELDLSAPLNFLIHEITSLKRHTFKKKPTFSELSLLTQYEKINYPLEKELISSSEGVSFSPKDEKARAVGLWLYDTIDGGKHFPSVIEAFNALRNGTCDNLVPKECEDLLAQLGYAASDPSVFRRLYRNTKRCIDACEVLSLKD